MCQQLGKNGFSVSFVFNCEALRNPPCAHTQISKISMTKHFICRLTLCAERPIKVSCIEPFKLTKRPIKGLCSVLKFGGILFTPIRLTAVACCASGPLKVRLSFLSQNVPSPPPKPLYKDRYTHRHLVTAHFSQLTKTVLTQLALITAHSGVHCGFKYQHWPMKRKLFLDQKGC